MRLERVTTPKNVCVGGYVDSGFHQQKIPRFRNLDFTLNTVDSVIKISFTFY